MRDALFSIEKDLTVAFVRRQQNPALQHCDAMRMFHGAGEVKHCVGSAAHCLKNIAVDRFGEHAWVTLWEAQESDRQSFERQVQKPLCDFLQQHFSSAVLQ